MKRKIDLHADDYGYSINTSKDIVECIQNRSLSSISIICNMPAFEESMEYFYECIPNFPYLPKISVHLNLVEGRSVFAEKQINYSWGQLFLHSYNPWNKKVYQYIKNEIKEQIVCVDKTIQKCIEIAKNNGVPISQKGIRIDSHVHTHMTPIVWRALVEVIEENGFNVEYIRNSKEPLSPFLKHREYKYKSVNIIKNIILMYYSKKVDKYYKKKGYDSMYMWGLIMSGEMDYKRIHDIIPEMKDRCEKDNRELEILFHPGKALKNETCPEMNPVSSVAFNMSENRRIEKESVAQLSQLIEKVD